MPFWGTICAKMGSVWVTIKTNNIFFLQKEQKQIISFQKLFILSKYNMFWLSYERFSIFCDVVLRKSVISCHNNCGRFLDHPWKFHFFFTWSLENLHTISSTPLEILCPQPFPLTPRLNFFWNSLFHIRISWTLFLIDPWSFHNVFLQYPWKFHVLNPLPPPSCRLLGFFLEQPIGIAVGMYWVVTLGKWPQSCFSHFQSCS